jgi:plasmid replication initiation protein
VIPLTALSLAVAIPGLGDGQGFMRALLRRTQRPEDQMARNRFVEIEGKRFLWRDVLRMRREQRAAHAEARQPALFELIEDWRPASERTASGRYLEPTLFSQPGREG